MNCLACFGVFAKLLLWIIVCSLLSRICWICNDKTSSSVAFALMTPSLWSFCKMIFSSLASFLAIRFFALDLILLKSASSPQSSFFLLSPYVFTKARSSSIFSLSHRFKGDVYALCCFFGSPIVSHNLFCYLPALASFLFWTPTDLPVLNEDF